jgi:hypothetical protein
MTDSFERKILRNVLGPTKAKGLWRIRHKIIYKLYHNTAHSTFLCLKKVAATKRGWRKIMEAMAQNGSQHHR